MKLSTMQKPRLVAGQQRLCTSSASGPFRATRPARLPSVAYASASALSEKTDAPQRQVKKARIKTRSDCELAVSWYPRFSYDAGGGGGWTSDVQRLPDGRFSVAFDPMTLQIPDLNYTTARIFGIPIPPPLNIAILPTKLAGIIDPETGIVELEFTAEFRFTAGPLYEAPPLLVATTLTTESSSGKLHAALGTRMAANGAAKLVGVARVPPAGDRLLDGFLSLPTDALAVLSAEFQFANEDGELLF